MLGLLLALASAVCAASPSGYVVKVEGPSVYLDLGEGSGAAAGRAFEVYTEGEELKHPVTGASLGKIETVVASGKIAQVAPQYSVGALDKPASVKAGQRVRLAGAPPAPAPAPAPASVQGGPALRAPRVKSPAFDYVIKALALGDFAGEGKPQLALASPTEVHVYPYPPQNATPLASYKIPGTGARPLGLEAGDLDGDGRAELFLAHFSETLGRVETTVLAYATGTLTKTSDLSFLVRSIQDGSGAVKLAGQSLVEDRTFPFSGIYPLAYADGKYSLSKPSIKPKRVDWLWDYTTIELDGKPATLYYTSNDSIRAQFEGGGHFRTREAFGQTPLRLRWPQRDGKLLEFHPRLRWAKREGKTALYAVRNHSALGSLSEPFGIFNGGEVRRLSWTGVAFDEDWRADLGGYSTELELVPSPADPRDLVLAVSGTSGKSSVWIFDP